MPRALYGTNKFFFYHASFFNKKAIIELFQLTDTQCTSVLNKCDFAYHRLLETNNMSPQKLGSSKKAKDVGFLVDKTVTIAAYAPQP